MWSLSHSTCHAHVRPAILMTKNPVCRGLGCLFYTFNKTPGYLVIHHLIQRADGEVCLFSTPCRSLLTFACRPRQRIKDQKVFRTYQLYKTSTQIRIPITTPTTNAVKRMRRRCTKTRRERDDSATAGQCIHTTWRYEGLKMLERGLFGDLSA